MSKIGPFAEIDKGFLNSNATASAIYGNNLETLRILLGKVPDQLNDRVFMID